MLSVSGLPPFGRVLVLLALCAAPWVAVPAAAQGVTTGALNGVVTDAASQPVAGASIVAIHLPSGTSYEATTRADGRFSIPGMRVGGPYSVTAAPSSASGSAFAPQTLEDVTINLGVATDLEFLVQAIAVEVTVTAESDPIISSDRTGAATAISRDALASIPTITGRLESITRLSPQAGSNNTFAGQDNRMNNITVDGSYFNNSFGIAGTPGERTGVAPISLSAIEQVQISVAPYDVRQGNFVGAAVNTVTRSGANAFRASAYHQFRDDDLVGTEAKGLVFNPGTFEYGNTGFWASGPIVRNRLFNFTSLEDESLNQPGTTFRANAGGEPVGGSVTRVLASDLNAISSLLASQFNYETGGFQDYPFETPALRFLTKADFNLNTRNKISFRYNHLDSNTDVLLSNSSSLGFGNRRTSTTGLNFQNSNYKILENIRSGVGEWHSILGTSMANNLIVGYTTQDESREPVGTMFPFVDVLQEGSVYTSFGFEPFTPNNELRYKTFQLQNNFTRFGDKHSLTFGASTERYESENVFFPGSQSVYVYNSLADFYTDMASYNANPNRTVSPITLNRFQVRWINIPGLEKPVQPLQVWYSGAYAQDDWRAGDNLKITMGLRVDAARFGDTGFENADADRLTFQDENGAAVQYSTKKLPDASLLWSPRVGFNWNVAGDHRTQVRGGSGVFTGRPAYVWISNQIGNTGVLTGFEDLRNTNARPFHPDPARYKPTNVTGAPASSYELALTDPDFRFPQTWRTNLAVDRRFGEWTGTAEFMYNRDVNGIYYINANQATPPATFAGPDGRPRWPAGNRIHPHVQNAVVLKNQNEGRSWNASGSVERLMRGGLWVKAAYSYGESRNTTDAGSIAFGSWNGNAHPGNPNTPPLAYAAASPGHRVFAAATYNKEFFRFGATTVSVFWEARNNGNASYIFSGDLNGDGGTSNDLVYIARDTSEMNFQQYTSGTGANARVFTSEQQARAWDAYIAQDPYLSRNRGRYAERNAVFLPFVRRMDLSVSQALFTDIAGRRNSFQVRVDVLNFGNLLNSDWGVGQRLVNNSPLIVASGGAADAGGRAFYRLRAVNNELMGTSYEPTNLIDDVYRVQFSLRYTFN